MCLTRRREDITAGYCWDSGERPGPQPACLTLVYLQRARLTQFHQLKSVVCKACLREDRRLASRQLWQPLHSGGSPQVSGGRPG